jgi:hypothetical protein
MHVRYGIDCHFILTRIELLALNALLEVLEYRDSESVQNLFAFEKKQLQNQPNAFDRKQRREEGDKNAPQMPFLESSDRLEDRMRLWDCERD